MRPGTMISGLMTAAAIGMAVGSMKPGRNMRRMKKRVNQAMRTVGDMADSLSDMMGDVF